MRNTKLLSDLLKTGLAGIILISEENWWQLFLHIILPCLANHKNDKFMAILNCILWDFDKKSGYFLFLLSIDLWIIFVPVFILHYFDVQEVEISLTSAVNLIISWKKFKASKKEHNSRRECCHIKKMSSIYIHHTRGISLLVSENLSSLSINLSFGSQLGLSEMFHWPPCYHISSGTTECSWSKLACYNRLSIKFTLQAPKTILVHWYIKLFGSGLSCLWPFVAMHSMQYPFCLPYTVPEELQYRNGTLVIKGIFK